MKYKYIATLLALLAIPSFAIGQSRSLPVLEVNPDARASAMGGNQYGESQNMLTYSNPTSLFSEKGVWNVSAASLLYPSGDAGRLKYYGFSASRRFGMHGIHAGIRYLGGYSFNMDDGSKLKPADQSVDMAYSIRLSNRFSATVGASFIQSKIFRKASTVAFNAAIYYRDSIDLGIKTSYVIGANAANAGPDLDYGSMYSSTNLPTCFGAGGEFRMELDRKNGLNISLSGQYYALPVKAKLFTSNIGAEYSYDKFLFVRTGYKFAENDFSSFAFGAGFAVSIFSLDFSYQKGLGKNHVNLTHFTLGINF